MVRHLMRVEPWKREIKCFTTSFDWFLEPDDVNPFLKCGAPKREEAILESEGLPIPDEMLLTIFVNLNVRDLVSASAVCKRWRKVAFR